jgi:hypothetical protein
MTRDNSDNNQHRPPIIKGVPVRFQDGRANKSQGYGFGGHAVILRNEGQAVIDGERLVREGASGLDLDAPPPIFAHTRWVDGGWLRKEDAVRLPPPQNGEVWLCDLVWRNTCWVALPRTFVATQDQESTNVE